MMHPSVHLNGTSRDELVNQAADAADALRQAVIALERTAPNSRDYYTQGDSAYSIARQEYEERVRAVRAVLVEIVALQQHIADA